MKKIVTTGMALSLAIVAHTCKQIRDGADSGSKLQSLAPLIEISPLEQGHGRWKVAAADTITVAVTAPGAENVRIQCRPEGMNEDYLEFQTPATPVDRAGKRFVSRLKLASDFAGDIWAEASYPGGAKKRTETIPLTAEIAITVIADRPDAVGGSVGTDESARSDKLNGGRIKRTRLIDGEPDIRITINAPAFLMTLWQNGKEVSSYPVGIGQKNFPVPVGERESAAIIFNPHWIPPDSVWAAPGNNVTTYEKIKPNDPRAALGQIKIPLRSGYVIHEAKKADEIGRAVSRGRILMLKADMMDLAEKIIAARDLLVKGSRISLANLGHERLVATLDPPLLVDINYDLQVVEGGALHIYPDVYDRGAFALDSLRAELHSAGVKSSMLEDRVLQRVLNQIDVDTQFVINIADIMKGRWSSGRKLPLVDKMIGRRREIAKAGGNIRRGAP